MNEWTIGIAILCFTGGLMLGHWLGVARGKCEGWADGYRDGIQLLQNQVEGLQVGIKAVVEDNIELERKLNDPRKD